VRREPSGIGDGQSSPANSPFNGARDIPVTGETHPASLSVPDNQADSDGKHTRLARRVSAAHQAISPAPAPAVAPARTTVSGRSAAPVGPVWISVPMVGQTPQS
jgi:hypothetical protein